jgi:hypothetical protein
MAAQNALTSPALTPARDAARGIPDIEHIKRHVPIVDVARALDIRVVGHTAHCWRPESHEHGDRTPSVWFSRKSNKGKCIVCDRWMWSNIDLVQFVLGCSTAAAVNWIASHFNVPRIAKRRPTTNRAIVPGRVGCGSPSQNFMRSGVFAKLPHPAKVLLFVFVEFCGDDTARLSYRMLQRVTGIGSRRTIKESLDMIEDIGLLKVERGHGGDGLRTINGYCLSWDDANLQNLMDDTHGTVVREIQAEKELTARVRAARSTYLGKTSVSSVNHSSAYVVHSVNHSRKEGKPPKSAAVSKRKGATA